jgi:hypothetical protein
MQTDTQATDRRLTLIYALALGVGVALYRLGPYVLPNALGSLWNFAPVGALALFVGSRLRGPSAFLVLIGTLLVSDLLLIRPVAETGYSALSWSRGMIYGFFAVYLMFGWLVRADELSPLTIVPVTMAGSVQFFALSNLAVWLGGTTYPMTFAGLADCFTLALPFFRNTLISDLLFSGLFFAAHAVLLWGSSLVKVRQPA